MATWIVVLAGVLGLAQTTDDFEAVATPLEVMTALTIPSANVVGNVGLDGDPDDNGWAEIERQAIILAESGNLLLIPSHAQGREPWIEAAKQMRDAGVMALKAARERDTDAFLDVGDAVFTSCSACHDVYTN